MKYKNIIPATFVARPNRFIAHVQLENSPSGIIEVVHVKNTGRCKELLIPGCRVYLEKTENPTRKTKYDLIAVEKIYPENSKYLIKIICNFLSCYKPFLLSSMQNKIL